MIAGIIAVAAGDRKVFGNPMGTADAATVVLLLGGSELFLAGHALFKTAMWHSFPLTRIAVIVVLALLVPISLQVPGLAVSAFSIGAIGLLVVLDRLHQPDPGHARAAGGRNSGRRDAHNRSLTDWRLDLGTDPIDPDRFVEALQLRRAAVLELEPFAKAYLSDRARDHDSTSPALRTQACRKLDGRPEEVTLLAHPLSPAWGGSGSGPAHPVVPTLLLRALRLHLSLHESFQRP